MEAQNWWKPCLRSGIYNTKDRYAVAVVKKQDHVDAGKVFTNSGLPSIFIDMVAPDTTWNGYRFSSTIMVLYAISSHQF